MYSGDDYGFDNGNVSAAAFSDSQNYRDYDDDDDGRCQDIYSDVISWTVYKLLHIYTTPSQKSAVVLRNK